MMLRENKRSMKHNIDLDKGRTFAWRTVAAPRAWRSLRKLGYTGKAKYPGEE